MRRYLFLSLVRASSSLSAVAFPVRGQLLPANAAVLRASRDRGSLASIVASAEPTEPAEVSGGSTAYDGDDLLVSAISKDGSISAKAIVTTNLVAETSRLQGLGGLAAAALGRAITCTILVAEGLKEEETFQVNFQGDGPLRGVLALANGRLEARGYVGNPAVTLPPNAKGKFDVGAGVGKGTLQVVRTKNLPGEEVSTPYTSITEIKTGEIPEDINWFLANSEQREGALAAGVFVQGTDDGVDRNGAPRDVGTRVWAWPVLLGGCAMCLYHGQALHFSSAIPHARMHIISIYCAHAPTRCTWAHVHAKDACALLLCHAQVWHWEVRKW